VIYCDEAANNLEDWRAVCDPELKRAASTGVEELCERMKSRAARRA
jgi:hypothetical protein